MIIAVLALGVDVLKTCWQPWDLHHIQAWNDIAGDHEICFRVTARFNFITRVF